MTKHPRTWMTGGAAALALSSLLLAGCGGLKTHPVQGRVEVAGGDLTKLVGSNVEFELESDSKVRGYGDIQEDGTFSMGMLHNGKQLKGVPEGKYRARILLAGDLKESDDDDDKPKAKVTTPVHPRFLKFETSGLSYTVPAQGDIVVKVARK